jgi:hypothetical protein
VFEPLFGEVLSRKRVGDGMDRKVKVFISYSSKDSQHRDCLRQQLEGMGYEVNDYQGNRAGNWKRDVEALITDCDYAVILLSPDYLQSVEEHHCMWEADGLIQNRDLDGRVFVVKIRACTPPERSALRDMKILRDKDSIGDPSERVWNALVSEDIAPTINRLGPRDMAKDPPLPSAPSLLDAVMQGTFTPFIGSLTNSDPDNYSSSLGHLKKRLDVLVGSLSVAEEQDYVRSVIAARVPQVLDARSSASTPDLSKEFLGLQVSLAQAGLAACRLFGEAMTQQATGIRSARDHRPPLDKVRPEKLLHFRDLLLTACDRADAAAESQDGRCRYPDQMPSRSQMGPRKVPPPCFGEGQIADKLVMLALNIFPIDALRHDDRGREFVLKQERAGRLDRTAPSLVDPSRLAVLPSLRMNHLEWLGQLLWHTIRFDAPMYPELEDLAFILSLNSVGAEPRSTRLGLAAALFDSDRQDLPPCMDHFLRWCDQERGKMPVEPRGLTCALAKALLANRESMSLNAGLASCIIATEGNKRPYALALTMSLDRELERAFQANGISHSVMFPIWLGQEAGWLLCKWTPEGASSWRCEWTYYGQNETTKNLPSQVYEPVIVRLQGAPLHHLPKGDTKKKVENLPPLRRWDGGAPTYRHRLLLSDHDLIRSLTPLGDWPDFIKLMLKQPGRICYFLNYPLQDLWGVLGLHQGVWAGEGHHDSRRWKFLVDDSADILRHGVLKRLDVLLDQKAVSVSRFTHQIHAIRSLASLAASGPIGEEGR